MRRIGIGLIGLAFWLGTSTPVLAQTTTTTTLVAVTWSVVRNADCTSAQAATGLTAAAVNCCQGLGAGFCDRRDTSGGTGFVRYVTLATAASQSYTGPGGDVLNAANLSKVGIANIVSFACQPSSAGHGVRANFTASRGQRDPKIQLFNGTTEIANATNIGGLVTDCTVIGY